MAKKIAAEKTAAAPAAAVATTGSIKIAEWIKNNAKARGDDVKVLLSELRADKAVKATTSDKAMRERLAATEAGKLLLKRYEAYTKKLAKAA